jgi:CspA family cold shock protein
LEGFGFTERDDGPDVFVHYTAIDGSGFRTLQEGDAVEFEVEEGPKGLHATNVKRVEAQPAAEQQTRLPPMRHAAAV